jgi:hypothetical protein
MSASINLPATMPTIGGRVDTFLLLAAQAGADAGRCVAELQRLVHRLGAPELLAIASQHEEPGAFLADLAGAAKSLRESLPDATRARHADLAADAVERNALDNAAIRRREDDVQRARALRREARVLELGPIKLRAELESAGMDGDAGLAGAARQQLQGLAGNLTPAEIDAIVSSRCAGVDERLSALRSEERGLLERVTRFDEFLADPQRDRGILGADLVAELEELRKGLEGIAGGVLRGA